MEGDQRDRLVMMSFGTSVRRACLEEVSLEQLQAVRGTWELLRDS